MTTHQITSLAGWYQVVETDANGKATPIGSFRTEADARDWLNTYLRMQNGRMQNGRMQNGAEVFKVGYSQVQAKTEAPIPASESN
jgi:hypothetical protein